MNRYFAGKPGQPRTRRAGDAIAIAFGLLLALRSAIIYGETSSLDQWFLDLLKPLPTWFVDVWMIAYLVGLILIIAVAVAAIVQKRRDLFRDMVLAVVATAVVALGLALFISDTLPTFLPEFATDVKSVFPIFRVAVVTGVFMVAAPHLARPVRWFGWATVLLMGFAGFGIGLGLPSDALGAMGIGLVAGGAVLLIFGSPKGYPDIEAVVEALADLGVEVDHLNLVPAQSWGVRTLDGRLVDGSSIEVLAYGRDAADTRLAAKTWHTLWYRDSDATISFSRLEAVEHNALTMLLAADGGVNTQRLLAVGVAGDDMAVLARTAVGSSLTEPSKDDVIAVWHELMKLHSLGIAHGSSTLDASAVADGRVLLGDFASATFNATAAQRSVDIVSLLFQSATVIGVDDAVEAASRTVPEADLVDSLAYLQVPALSPEQRDLVDKPKAVVKELRAATAEVTGADLPEPAKMRRIRPKDLIMPALSLIAISALLGMLADIDFAAVWEIVRDAAWGLIIFGFIVAQLSFFFDATGTLFATGYALPLKPLLVLQYAVRWIGLAVPSAAGRVTMNTMFLRKYGVPTTDAVTQGAVDSLSGFMIEATILLVAIIATDPPLDIDTGDVAWGAVLLIVLIAIVGTVVAVLRVKRLHDMVIPPLKSAWRALSSVAHSPKRAFGLLGSNLGSRVFLAGALWLILDSIGTPLPLVACLVVVVATNLLGGLVPIPGGVGVSEAVMTSFLVMAGVDQDSAFAAAVVWRIATFYVPAGLGFLASKWLENGEYI